MYQELLTNDTGTPKIMIGVVSLLHSNIIWFWAPELLCGPFLKGDLGHIFNPSAPNAYAALEAELHNLVGKP